MTSAHHSQVVHAGKAGLEYDVELDDGHVYRASYAKNPPTTADDATLCDEPAATGAPRYYSLALTRGVGDVNSELSRATRVR